MVKLNTQIKKKCWFKFSFGASCRAINRSIFFIYIKNFCCAEVELIRELRNENEIPMKAKIYLKLFFMWCRFDFSLKSFFSVDIKNTNKSSFCIYDRKIYYKE